MKSRPVIAYRKELQTTLQGRSGTPEDFVTWQDVETDRGGAEARKGMVRLTRIANSASIMDFDGTNNTATLASGHAKLYPLGTVFTLETLFETDTLSADRFILGRATASACGITIKQTTTETVVLVITDSAAATTTLTWTSVPATTRCALQLTRDGAAVTGWLNGTTQTGTMSATNSLASAAMAVGSDNAGSYHDGGVDFLRIWDIARTDRRDIQKRLVNPRNPHVLFNWVFTQGTNDDIVDSGLYGAHAVTSGSPAFNRSGLASNPATIQALSFNVRKSGAREVVAAAFGSIYTATVG